MFEIMRDTGFATAGALAMGALYGLLAAALVLFAMRRLGLLVRQNRIRRLIAATYYFYIPIVFAGVGAVWLASSAAQQKVVAAFDAARPEIAALSAQAAEGIWTAIQGRAPQGDISVKEVVLAVTREYVEQRFFTAILQDPATPKTVREFVGLAATGMSQATVAALESRIIEALAGQVSVSPETLRVVWDRKILQAMRDGLVADLIALHINKPFQQFESSAKISGLLLMLPVILETAFAMFALRRRKIPQVSETVA